MASCNAVHDLPVPGWARLADGLCKSFDARADGYVRAEGVFAFAAKELARAEVDGDEVLAVIRVKPLPGLYTPLTNPSM